jgi:hypothetical protein
MTALNNTFAPFSMSFGRENSFGEWLMPPMLGMKIMPTGPMRAISCAARHLLRSQSKALRRLIDDGANARIGIGAGGGRPTLARSYLTREPPDGQPGQDSHTQALRLRSGRVNRRICHGR